LHGETDCQISIQDISYLLNTSERRLTEDMPQDGFRDDVTGRDDRRHRRGAFSFHCSLSGDAGSTAALHSFRRQPAGSIFPQHLAPPAQSAAA